MDPLVKLIAWKLRPATIEGPEKVWGTSVKVISEKAKKK